VHEWALAEAVLQSVQDEIASHTAGGGAAAVTVRSVKLLFGELQKIDREVFLIGLKELCRDTPLAAEAFHLETERASFKCNRCGRKWHLEELPDMDEETREAIHFLPESAHAYMRCPDCRSPDFTVETGRGVVIQSIELVQEDRPAGEADV